ncbi:hypothetical protein AKJ16_DCAP08599 [Drosera capensis]
MVIASSSFEMPPQHFVPQTKRSTRVPSPSSILSRISTDSRFTWCHRQLLGLLFTNPRVTVVRLKDTNAEFNRRIQMKSRITCCLLHYVSVLSCIKKSEVTEEDQGDGPNKKHISLKAQIKILKERVATEESSES